VSEIPAVCQPVGRAKYFTLVVATVAIHFAYLVFLPSGGFLALRWRRTLWLHLPTVCWGVGVVALEFPCPLTSLEAWARARASTAPLPETGFTGRYVSGVVCPANQTGTAQSLAFVAAAVSWIALAIQARRSGVCDGQQSITREAN
jgi:hypothetical protein